MGAGRIIYQELTKITKSIEDGDFFENKALLAACENVKKNDSALHLMGLYLTEEFIVILLIFMEFLSSPRDRESRKYMFIVSLTAVIHHRHQVKSM